MSKPVNIYVKKKLELGRLNFSQRQMLAVGNAGLNSIKARTARAYDASDKRAAPLKPSFRIKRNKDGSVKERVPLGYSRWARIKKSRGLKPIRDLRGTGQMYSDAIAKARNRVATRANKLKNVGHMISQIMVRKVSETRAYIVEPTTVPGRVKARANADMLMMSPNDIKHMMDAAGRAFSDVKKRLVKIYVKKPG